MLLQFNNLCGSSDDSVLLAFFCLYYFSLFLFLLCLTSIFQKSEEGIITIAIISMLIIIPAIIFETYALYCIPSCALFYFVRIVLITEAQETGIQWTNLFYKLVFGIQINIGIVMASMIACWLLFWVLYWYFGKVVPEKYAGGRIWSFPFKRRYWTRKIRKKQKYFDIEKNDDDKMQTKNENLFEAEPIGKVIGVEIAELGKKYKNWVLINLSLRMYESEVTTILGDNGAGKSTLISILTGSIPATKGQVIINGYDISHRKERNEARLIMGLSPQHNVLFDNLTVAQNIRFHIVLKDIDDREIESLTETFLEKLNLKEKRKMLCKHLSTSQKRMLSVGCAFCGYPKVVFLDEPSHGMDNATKLQFWSFLLSEKTGCTILITTRYTDEANALGDRIAVLRLGEIKCYGSTNFLKKEVGVGTGYYLICNKTEQCKVGLINKLLLKFIPNIVILKNNGSEIVYEIPKNNSKQVQTMLQQLDKQKEKLGIKLGVSSTTLENVYLKIGCDKFAAISDQNHEACSIMDQKVTFIRGERIQSTIFWKRYKILSRRWCIFLLLVFLPIIYVITVVMMSVGLNVAEPDSLQIRIRSYPKVIFPIFVEQNLSKQLDYGEELKTVVSAEGGEHVFGDKELLDFAQFILDLGIKDQAIINALYVAGVSCTEKGIVAWFNNQFYHSAPLAVNILYNALAKQFIGPNSGIVVYNKPLPISKEYINDFLRYFPSMNVAKAMILGLSVSTVLLLPPYIKERTTKAKLMQHLRGVNFLQYWIPSFLLDYAIYLSIVVVLFIIISCGKPEGLETTTIICELF